MVGMCLVLNLYFTSETVRVRQYVILALAIDVDDAISSVCNILVSVSSSLSSTSRILVSSEVIRLFLWLNCLCRSLRVTI